MDGADDRGAGADPGPRETTTAGGFMPASAPPLPTTNTPAAMTRSERPAAMASPEPAPHDSLTIATPTTGTSHELARMRADHGPSSGRLLRITSPASGDS
jgi:hypothetical protein